MQREPKPQPRDELMTRRDQLPFDEAMQEALLGWLCWFRAEPEFKPQYETFFLSAKDHLKPEWFLDPYHKKLWAFRQDFYEKHKRSPKTFTEFLMHPTFTVLDQKEKTKLQSKLQAAIISAHGAELDEFVLERLETWIRAQTFLEHMAKGVDLYNKHCVIETFDEMSKMYRDLQQVKLNSAGIFPVSDFAHNAAYTYKNLQNALTLGHPVLDQCLLPESSTGSLLPGDTTVVLAPTNMGKTTFLINVIVENIVREKHVLFITHEGRPEDITQKIWMRLLGWTKSEYLSRANDPAWSNYLSQWAVHIEKYLTYVPMVKAGLTVEDVEVSIRKLQDEHKSTYGRYYDLVVDDYPDKLTSRRAERGELNKRNTTDIVYSYFVQLALEYESHSLVAFQTNREGARINRGHGKEDRLLTMEDASEAYGPMMTATNVITLNRPPRAISKGLIILNVCKSRSSETGIAVAIKSDYSRATTHKKDSQCTWWRNFGKMPDMIEDYLTQYLGRETPLTEIIDHAMKSTGASKEAAKEAVKEAT